MTEENSSRAPDTLLQQSAFVRSVAQALLRDDHSSDDVVQDTWLAAMTTPPRNPATAGPWLTTVVRNFVKKLHRSRTRRSAREVMAAKPEAIDGPSDLFVRQAILREVVDAVGELPDAYREVILLRYYEDLPPREIAARLGCPTTTVQSRLQRAHEALRRRLEQKNESGDWRAQLLLLIGRPTRSSVPMLATASIAALFLVAVVVTTRPVDRSPQEDLFPVAAASPAADPPVPPRRRGFVAVVPRTIDSRAEMTVSDVATVRVIGRVIDEDREPRADVAIVARVWGEETSRTTTNAAGEFSFDVPKLFGSDGISIVGRSGKNLGFETHRPVGPTGRIDFGTIPLRRTRPVKIAVRFLQAPVAAATVRIRSRDRRVLDDVLLPPTDIDVHHGTTDEAGRLTDLRLTSGQYDCFVTKDGTAGKTSFFVFDDETADVVVDLSSAARRTIKVVDEKSGEPVADASIIFDETRVVAENRRFVRDLLMPLTRTDESGTASFTIPPDGATRRIVAALPGRGSSAPILVRDDQASAETTVALKSAPTVTVDRPMPRGRVQIEVAGEIVSAARVVDKDGRPTIEGWTATSGTVLLRSDSDDPAYEVERSGKDITVRDLPQRELSVTIEDADGRPVPNLECELIDDHPKFARARRVASDASGKFSVRGLVGKTAQLEFGPQNDLFDSRRRIEVVTLDAASTEHVIRIGERRRLEIEILLAGRRTIPSVFTILAVKAFTGLVAEDRDNARMTVDFWNDDRIATPEFIIHAPGYQPQAVMLPREGRIVTQKIDLEQAGRVVVELVGTEVKDTDLCLDWISDADVPTTLQHGGRSRSPQSREVEFDGLKNGRYRIRDIVTGLSCAPFRIENADRTTRVTMDMTSLRTVELCPVFGDGEHERRVVFQLFTESDAPFETITRAINTPSSSVKIAGATEIRIRALDPDLVIATPDGTMAIEPGVDRITLPLVRGASARLLLPEESCGMGWATLERVDAEHTSIIKRPISSRGEIGRFGAVPTGRYKITLRLDDHLPLEIGEWTLVSGENQLPEFDFDPGSSIVFRFAASTIGRLPPLDITVRRDDGSVERVGAYKKDEQSVTIGGLTAGVKTVEFRGKNLGLVAPPATRVVKLDARGQVVVEID